MSQSDPSQDGRPLSRLAFEVPPGPLSLVVVGCGAAKQAQPCAAKNLYQGRHFRLCRSYAELNAQAWCILSAKHLVVHPEQVIGPYDARMPSGNRQIGKPGSLQYQCAYWLAQRFGLYHRPGSHFTVLAGKDYAAVFSRWGSHFLKGVTWSCPLDGMGIGEQDSWLLEQVRVTAA